MTPIFHPSNQQNLSPKKQGAMKLLKQGAMKLLKLLNKYLLLVWLLGMAKTIRFNSKFQVMVQSLIEN